jgi:hypothetical protein
MDVSGIGVQPISPTTGTPAQKQNPSPAQAGDSARARESAARVNRPSDSDTGNIVDKVA